EIHGRLMLNRHDLEVRVRRVEVFPAQNRVKWVGQQLVAGGLALGMLLVAGCIARQMRIAEHGLTCAEAQKVAIEAVRRMGYTISEANKAAPGSPGVIVASREVGTTKEALLVQVFCTTQGVEVEAKTDQGALAQLSVSNEFRRSFEVSMANRAPPRP